MKTKRIKFFPTKVGVGHYKIVVSVDYKNVGEFITTNIDMVEDIHNINNGDDLYHYDNEEYFKEYVLRMFERYGTKYEE